MKKKILMSSLLSVAISLMAFNLVNRKPASLTTDQQAKLGAFYKNLILSPNHAPSCQQVVPDLYYGVENRFNSTITKERVNKAKTIFDILPAHMTEGKNSFQRVRLTILGEDQIMEMGDNELLNPAQLQLLQSADYSSDFSISGIHKRSDTFLSEEDSVILYLTIIPEKQASYEGGEQALISYLRENSSTFTSGITRDKLQPGKVRFTVSKTGAISNVKLDATSGYPLVDKQLEKLISNMPDKWTPASNAQGEKVDQELVFFFGLQGC